MSYDCTYLVYDHKGHCIGFTDSELEAKEMAAKYNGRYELEFLS